jgi:hypothetical protein
MSYPLYHTLNKNLKTTDLSSAQKTKLLAKLSDLDLDKKRAIIMLIIEHAKVSDGVVVKPENFSLPYDVKQVDKDVCIDLENLPISLKWIIWKFIELPSK